MFQLSPNLLISLSGAESGRPGNRLPFPGSVQSVQTGNSVHSRNLIIPDCLSQITPRVLLKQWPESGNVGSGGSFPADKSEVAIKIANYFMPVTQYIPYSRHVRSRFNDLCKEDF